MGPEWTATGYRRADGARILRVTTQAFIPRDSADGASRHWIGYGPYGELLASDKSERAREFATAEEAARALERRWPYPNEHV